MCVSVCAPLNVWNNGHFYKTYHEIISLVAIPNDVVTFVCKSTITNMATMRKFEIISSDLALKQSVRYREIRRLIIIIIIIIIFRTKSR
jgi:hypothetical protein